MKYLGMGMMAITATMLPCDQNVYDSLYRTIISQTVIQITPEDFEERNIAIQTLRRLCKGQRSTYESPHREINSHR